VQFTWLGAAGFKLETQAGAIILINPFLSRPHQATPALLLQLAELTPVDEILLSDSRFDYAMDTPALVKQTGAIVHASSQVCQHLTTNGVPAHNLQPVSPHVTKTIARLRWQAWPVDNQQANKKRSGPPANSEPGHLATLWPASQMVNYTLQAGGLTIVHISNTNWIDPEIKGLQPDIALLPVTPSAITNTIPLVVALKPAVIIPHQWDNYYPPFTQGIDSHQLKDALQTKITTGKIFLPTLGQPFDVADLLQ
jgi:L-ascorbate metabolism protein UlaG (beta-lactamase superfamily)